MQKRTIWRDATKPDTVEIIDQRRLPHEVSIVNLSTVEEVEQAIRDMWVRGAPLIGATAAYGMAILMSQLHKQNTELSYEQGKQLLLHSRPTAVNLAWAVQRMDAAITQVSKEEQVAIAWALADAITEEDVSICRGIAEAGLPLIRNIHQQYPQRPVNILTHCNAGRMATVEWGTATAPIYLAHSQGIPVHVWVDETRPRNQGASITAWELADAGIPHTLIADNAGGHLMQHGSVDLVIVGSDRTTKTGDVANKIGTYLKALAAHDNAVPFYVALPSPTIDWTLSNGVDEIPIEERSQREITHITGWEESSQQLLELRLSPAGSPAANPAFDVTPARLVTGLITERGICEASEAGLWEIFPERAP
ncbi:MAG: S-methyl-5-thioribose-1-phosphate isomerase [Bacteroidia bacterium]|nr:S-methyl-5-thioribose-1-phosphate isomerase [Bacteroidia bacterium]